MKRIVITGASSGIGLATAKCLAPQHELILLCRTAAKAAAAKRQIEVLHPRASVRALAMELHQPESVKAAATEILQAGGAVHVLINNAGYYPEKIEYEGEVEKTLYASHLGHMLLTLYLLPLLNRATEARIINVSSALHAAGKYTNLFARVPGLTPFQAYADAKLANVLFTLALADKLNPSVCSFSLHPGVVATGFDRNIKGWFKALIAFSKPLVYVSPQAGAATSVYLATADRIALKPFNGGYFTRCKPARIKNTGVTRTHAELLWNHSMDVLLPHLP